MAKADSVVAETRAKEQEEETSSKKVRPPIHVPLALALVGGVTLLILIAVGSVLIITLAGASENTFSLIGRQATTSLDLLESRINSQLEPIEIVGDDLAVQFADGRLNLDDRRERAFDTFRGVFASLPQVTAVLFIPVEGEALRTTITEGIVIEVPPNPRVLQRQRTALENAHQQPGPEWSAPFWIQNINRAVVTQLVPVRRGEDFFGLIAVTVSLDNIVQFLADLERLEKLSSFILYDRDFVLGHPLLLETDFNPGTDFADNPLPTVDDVPDPAFRLLNGAGDRADQLLQNAPTVTDARVDDDFIIITRDVNNFGPIPWTVGLKFRTDDVSGEVDRLRSIAIAGLIVLIIAVIVGFLFARLLNQKIGQLATAAETMSGLDMAKVPPVPDSFLSELSNAANAFNTMIGALRWFETYVPKSLVLRLMQQPDEASRSVERELTILFTDISGFSTLAEDLTAEQTASLLNAHFELLSNCVEAEGGTVDKFIGDSLMAFWGAPEEVEDHAARALRAGAAIQEAIVSDNFKRVAADKQPVSVRVGIHTGKAIIGNIGSKSRINYTVVGDTVNVASRLEQLSKDFEIRDQCVVLVSKESCDSGKDALGEDSGITFSEIGDHNVRGRSKPVTVFRVYAAEK
ncbi:MAG: adenylate/guanylate cyclase domain-containing protein [Alphaproteobacteria bacterium]|nr:adenylate/guanylate cyclase domain-containing protein [Alphaproteobacteria bacterium]